MQRLFLFSAALAVICSSAVAEPYMTASPTTRTSTIHATDVSADYSSLAAAAAAINATPLTGGDWTFLIASDLTETGKIGIGQNTNGNSLIFRPAPGTQPTVTFEQPSAGSGWGNHLVFGSPSPNSNDAEVPTQNVVIDGSNDGTDSRDMTITNLDNGNALSLLAIADDSDNAILRNLILENTNSSTGFVSAVRIGSYSDGVEDGTPDNVLVENCEIRVPFAGNGVAISIDAKGDSQPTLGASGTNLVNNEIVASAYGIRGLAYRDIAIDNNRIIVDSQNGSSGPMGIQLASTNTTSSTNYAVELTRNWIQGVGSNPASGFSPRGILISSSIGGASDSVSVLVENNMIAGIANTSTDPSPVVGVLQGLSISAARVAATVQFNSIEVPAQPAGLTVTSPELSAAIYFDGNNDSTYDFNNNILRVDHPGVRVYSVANASPLFSSDNNNLTKTDGGTPFASAGAGNLNTLADWSSAYLADSSSTDVDPRVSQSGSGVWTSASDLRFNGPADPAFQGDNASVPAVDIDGDTRSTTAPYKGADELPSFFNSSVSNWIILE